MKTSTRSRTPTQIEIFNEITSHINNSNRRASQWYVGITNDIDLRLFGAHNVSEDYGWWYRRYALTANNARIIEQDLLEWGCDGGSGGGNNQSVYVYAFLKTSTTIR